MSYQTLEKCRICENTNLDNIISLGFLKNTSIFPQYGTSDDMDLYPVNLCLCNKCGLVQLKETTQADTMYKSGGYGYKSSISNTMRTHLKNYNDEILEKVNISDNDVVVDIGSNDATFLHYYDKKLRRIGVDPTGVQFKEYYDDLELLPDYFNKENFITTFGDIKCKIITSICMFYDLPQPVQFAKDIYDLLDDDGIWTCEQSYLLRMLETNSIDTICHEHLEYYCLSQIKYIADQAKLKIIDVKFNESNGGSFRIYFAKNDCKKYEECSKLIFNIIGNEKRFDIKNPEMYKNFMKNCNKELNKLTEFIDVINKSNKTVYIYGASTKGNCVLQYCNITEDKVKYAVERNPEKIGKCTNTGIEIISEETMRKNPPDFLIVLPWHFKDEIIKREKKYLDNGGQLIFYFPTFEIVSNLPKILITGCDGFLGRYMKEEFYGESLYGITRNKNNIVDNIIKFNTDMTDYKKLEFIIQLVNPNKIIHLAGTSSSIDAFENPIQSLQNNGMIVSYLCEIILQNNKEIKLFNASSSEIYKGHVNYIVEDTEESIQNTKHLHPYSIGKIMGQQIVQFYRKTHNLKASNGILFTIQSSKKSTKFLLNKLHKHIKTDRDKMITIGQLDSFRNILHPFDVCTAIRLILDQDESDDFIIANNKNHYMYDVVKLLYEKHDIHLQNKNDNQYILINKETKKPLIEITSSIKGIDQIPINIQALASKLQYLGWRISYSIEDILNEFFYE